MSYINAVSLKQTDYEAGELRDKRRPAHRGALTFIAIGRILDNVSGSKMRLRRLFTYKRLRLQSLISNADFAVSVSTGGPAISKAGFKMPL